MAGGMKPRPPFIPHVPFDLVLAEPAFPPVESPSTEQDEAMLNVRNSFSPQPRRQILIEMRILPLMAILV